MGRRRRVPFNSSPKLHVTSISPVSLILRFIAHLFPSSPCNSRETHGALCKRASRFPSFSLPARFRALPFALSLLSDVSPHPRIYTFARISSPPPPTVSPQPFRTTAATGSGSRWSFDLIPRFKTFANKAHCTENEIIHRARRERSGRFPPRSYPPPLPLARSPFTR